jgi:nicotinamidase-related amidase
LGALNLGYFTFLLKDAVKGIEERGEEEAIRELLKRGAVAVEFSELSN